jgi:IS30 family transposase
MKEYKQLTQEQRYQIHALRKVKKTLEEIARVIRTDKSTVSRELTRNKGKRGYRAQQAHGKAMIRREMAFKKIKLTKEAIKMISEKIKIGWSPEQIAGRFKKEKLMIISYKTIYRLIEEDTSQEGNLHTYLRRSNKKRKKKYGSNNSRGQIINRISIDMRPKIVDKKKRIGDWELDTIIGKNHKGAIVTAVERKTKLTAIKKVKSKNAQEVEEAVVSMLFPFKKKVFSLTSDNGKEFAGHNKIAKRLNAKFYFAHPYHSCERGLNENTNGLIRQYIPKKTNFNFVDDRMVASIEQRLNERPRKGLNFKTPAEAFDLLDRW